MKEWLKWGSLDCWQRLLLGEESVIRERVTDDVYILYTIAVYELKFYEHKTYNLKFLKFNCI